MLRKLPVFLLAALLLTLPLFAGCAPSSPDMPEKKEETDTITVRYDPSKYGTAWLDEAAKIYETEHPKVKIRLTADASILQSMSAAFNRGRNLPDVALLPATNWQEYAKRGWLDDLTALSSAKADGGSIAQRLVQGLRDFGTLGGKEYVLPYADGVCGFLYNKSLFEKNGWTVPKTASELTALLGQIAASGVLPVVWPGKDPTCWDGVVNAWWAQSEGLASIRDFLSMKNAGVYRQQGRLTALSLFESIVAGKQDTAAGTAVQGADPTALDTSSAFSVLAKGDAALMPGSAWMVSKYGNAIAKGTYIGIMVPPAPDGAKEPSLYDTESGDFICIPAKAANRAGAEDFVRFLASSRAASVFYKETGVPSAFGGIPADCVPAENAASPAVSGEAGTSNGFGSAVSSGDAASSAVSSTESAEESFARDVYSLYTGSQKLYLYSKKAVYYSHFLNWPGSGSPYLAIFRGDTTAAAVFSGDADYAAQQWASANSDSVPTVSSVSSATPASPSKRVNP